MTVSGAPPAGIWVKICGVTDPTDAEAAAAAGASAVGVVSRPASPRHAPDDVIRAVVAAAAPVPVVAVTVERDPGELAALGVAGVQLHGAARAAVPRLRHDHPGLLILRVCPVPPDCPVWPPLRAEGADLVLVDAAVPGVPGGTGRTLAWQRPEADAPVVLAGGLTPENVAEAVAAVAPYGVDVSSGVESSPGVKDARRVADFVAAARAAARV